MRIRIAFTPGWAEVNSCGNKTHVGSFRALPCSPCLLYECLLACAWVGLSPRPCSCVTLRREDFSLCTPCDAITTVLLRPSLHPQQFAEDGWSCGICRIGSSVDRDAGYRGSSTMVGSTTVRVRTVIDGNERSSFRNEGIPSESFRHDRHDRFLTRSCGEEHEQEGVFHLLRNPTRRNESMHPCPIAPYVPGGNQEVEGRR